MKVAAITGSRADYGLLRPTLRALREDPRFEPALLVTAMHLDPVYGETIAEIEADGNVIAARVPAGAPVRDPGDFARNIGLATVAFSDALAQCAPDALLVLGDRFEVLAGALAATSLGIPVAHLHGGELSEGSLDDALRHCVTKLSCLHFVSTRAYAERVCQLGEDPASVHVVGAAASESIARLTLLDRAELASALALDSLPHPLVALTVHAESCNPSAAEPLTRAVTEAVDEVLAGAGCAVATLPNDDPGSAVVRELLRTWGEARENVRVFATLGQLRYLSLLACADAVVGNSSSAIIEAPSFRVPVVNVGERQRGRLAAANTIDCQAQRASVVDALRGALDPAFRASLAGLENPYDHGGVAAHILSTLGEADFPGPCDKRFFDLPDGVWRSRLQLARTPGGEERVGGAVKLVLAGGGGHARAVLDALRTSATALEPVVCTDPDPRRHGESVDGVPIEGNDELLGELRARGFTGACIGVGGTADNNPRAALFERLDALGFELPPVVHGSAHVAASATLGAADVVLAGAVVGAGVACGKNVIVGSNVVVEHDCRIDDHVHLASGCVIGGAVTVRRGAHVGLGARVLQGRTVGERAIVGAGAVVIEDVPAGETVIGCPARTKTTAR